MAVSLPNGVTLALATTYAASVIVNSITNATNPLVTTSAVHGLAIGDIVEMTSGWSRLNNRLVRVLTVPLTTTFTIEGIDTTSTTLYPAGTGAGSLRKITAFTQISQILELTSSGGDMQFVTYSFLEQDFETQLPTQASPQQLSITIADDQTLAGYIAMKAAATTRALTGFRAQLPNGSVLYYNGYVNFDETPSLTKNQLMGCKGGFALQNRPVRY
jgi:hypothetical protein